ncbi:hypothetical protein [Streptomyces sp. NPDC094049]|uniref:hypothetical protein n=1 Tax=Streptomyces sp. NPDC094049 TaxID=3154987 RepID=UPI00332E8C63
MHGLDEPWRWADEASNLSCPQAPHPLDTPSTPKPLADVWPEERWASFLDHWHAAHAEPLASDDLINDHDLRPYLPRTTYGDYHAFHLDNWLTHRAGIDCDGYTVIQAGPPRPGEPNRWRVTRTESAK